MIRAACLIAVLAASTAASTAAAETGEAPSRPKKLAELQSKVAANAAAQGKDLSKWHRKLDKRIGKEPEAIINIHNNWTLENLPIAVDKKKQAKLPKPLLDRFFRCHFTNSPTNMDPRLFNALVNAARHFDSPRIDIVSAYRSPKFNLILRKKGRGVARRSQHTLGHAVDFRVRGVSTGKLRDWARSQKLGGVGYYAGSKFIHMDTWRVRYWTGQ